MLKLNKSFRPNPLIVILLACLVVITGIAVGEAWAKEKKNVVMLRWRYKDRSEEAFEKVLNSSQYEIIWQDFCADEKKDKLAEIIKSLDTSKIDLIYAFGTTVTKALKEAIKDVPIVFNIVTDPVAAGVVDSWEHSGNNFTGASNGVPVESQIKSLKQVMDFKRLGMLHNPSEANSVILRDGANALEGKYGFTLIEAKFTTKEDLDSAIKTLMDERADAVWLSSISAVIANKDIILKAINEKKLPTMTTQINFVDIKDKDAALIGLGPDYYKLGELAGQKALEIFAGKKPNDIPSETLKTFDLIINLQTARKIGIKIPVKILKMATKIIE